MPATSPVISFNATTNAYEKGLDPIVIRFRGALSACEKMLAPNVISFNATTNAFEKSLDSIVISFSTIQRRERHLWCMC